MRVAARLSTLNFARKAAAFAEGGAEIRAALDSPQAVEILETMDAHQGARFFVLFPYQTFKSLIGQARMLRNHRIRSAPSGWYVPSDEFAKDFADTKINPWADAIPQIEELRFPGDKTKTTKLKVLYCGGASQRIFSANTESDRHGKTLRDIYFDEVHMWKSGCIEQISNRRGSFPYTFTETFMSTGLTKGEEEGGEATQIWETTDQRTWHCRCPKCDGLFEPLYLHRDAATQEIIGGLRYEKAFLANGMPDPKAIADTLSYQCPRCQEKFPDNIGSRELFSGTSREPRGCYVAKNPNALERNFGWNCHGIALRPWLPMVMRFETAQLARSRGDIEPLGKCIREEFAGIWDPEKYLRPETQSRYQHPTPYNMRDEWSGEIKDAQGRPFRFAHIDVQQDYFVYVSRKWGRFSQSRMQFAAICLSPSEIQQHLTADGVPAERVFFDSRFDSQRIRSICALMGWRTMMGDKAMRDYMHPDGIRRIYDEPKKIDAFTGTIHEGQHSGGFVWETLFSKNSALNRLALLRSADSKAPDGTPLWTAAADAPDWYFKQINAHFLKLVHKPDGTSYRVWHGHKDDHADDCEAMAMPTASMASLTGAESLPAANEHAEKNQK